MSSASKLGNTQTKGAKSKTLAAAGKTMTSSNVPAGLNLKNFPTDAEIEAFQS